MPRTLILGAGFGGLAVATVLRDRLGDDHEFVLFDAKVDFLAGLRKLWAVVGHGTLEEGRRSRATLNERGIPFRESTITGIDPESRRVTTADGTLDGDHLVVALGATPRPDLIPGFESHAHNLYAAADIPALASEIARFDGGRILITIAGAPYKCPPAPYECAMLLEEHLRDRGIRDRCELVVATLQPMLLPNAGREGSGWLAEQLEARGIEAHVGRRVKVIEAGRVVFAEGPAIEADLIIGVPPHRVPDVVRESGLTGDGEWIPVSSSTLETRFPGVFAIGDVNQIKLANGLPLPKAGLFAELQGQRVAHAIASGCRGGAAPPAFAGQGYCFLEMGKAAATFIEGDFFADPEPRVSLGAVSERHAADKREFESERLRRWFGG